jgi:hypothetical protein
MEAPRIFAGVAADVRRGWRASFEDIAVAALVVLPFTGALGVLVGAMTGWPSAFLIVLTGLAQGVATYWNAGWRARPAE